ncbi:MAG: type I restriction enzyme HsdR N-terminal domain-containing protein [Cyclobacteriaceae bacterium]|nr:type I restriction enzyme HsdR N-terminal domain-containing protein [Cyclobacteriaceae bacterium]
MLKLNLPDTPLRIFEKEGKKWVFDGLRKKNIRLTPEEWVRQHFIYYLMNDRGYPGSLIRVEAGHDVNRLRKRTDILVYNNMVEPVLLVECKAPDVVLNQKTLDQLVNYNHKINAGYIVLTNGLHHFVAHYQQEKGYVFLDTIPQYSTIQ